jgi:hypothetical protein
VLDTVLISGRSPWKFVYHAYCTIGQAALPGARRVPASGGTMGCRHNVCSTLVIPKNDDSRVLLKEFKDVISHNCNWILPARCAGNFASDIARFGHVAGDCPVIDHLVSFGFFVLFD